MTEDVFRISSHLKDIIGRDLVTNQFVAIFELVKNSFDAGATKVDIEFDPEEQQIAIIDNGHGMSRDDITKKWLFVAYSEKAMAESGTYRDKIKPAGQFAGSKGIGRFACDTLGEKLELYSLTEAEKSISKLKIDWTEFERDSTEEFQNIPVSLEKAESFPITYNVGAPSPHGTVLLIKNTRHHWDEERISRLRRDLAKLIDPFGTTTHVSVSTWLIDYSDKIIENVDGPIGNEIAELLQEKTSRIVVSIENSTIESTLIDRGRKIYSIKEPSPYNELNESRITGEIYYLNRAAKQNFTLRMGVRPIEFGSVFLFLNKFRIYPIGEENDDTLGLNRRKQQGQSRYLGTRDIIGRIDVIARPKMFREVSSRDAGLVEDACSRALYEAIRRHMIFRLERYVVGVNWQDKTDQNKDTPERLETDESRERILNVIGALARSKDIEILYYDKEILQVSEDPDQITDEVLKTMSEVAENQGDTSLRAQIEEAKKRIVELRASREEAREIAQRAIEDRNRADAHIARLEQQAAFLGSSQDVDIERTQLLMHQATIHLGHIRSAIANSAHELRNVLSTAQMPSEGLDNPDDIEDLLASIRQSTKRASASIASATLSGDRLSTVLSFAPNIRVDLQTDKVHGDLVQFLDEYFDVRLAGMSGVPRATFDDSGESLIRDFSPVDIAVLVDNLLDNARKAKASKLEFKVIKKTKSHIKIHVSDDGLGIDERKVDPSKIFERGYTGSDNGTGIGLYSVSQIIKDMGGSIELVGDGSRADFEITIPGDK
ncbi:histidine kinase [Pseudomonas aeruginosa]|uniref:histidine kinase n=1 Tax=Pseudomonas paraeruginosa (strain DSM 24068 / PA7) TaxID=381754 RepID=A6V495_PSEP7|nr:MULTISPECIES: ATP-binding protein [Pseudomonas aeruginosa group]ABR86662.1 putative prophage encoded two-component system histidine kinase [Pseudomonas aeruginosa PA7]MCW8363282.1 ATP-binding protein [Pseudomonas aeruginosa]MCW8369415.1 ATP-binding protein [Pseudomonas aeruginosa]MCX3381366.1 ATP-binding protein [Pseudomonas aeruginosa]MEB6159225.1 ATP-binding protein [Pseudomonas aeruginosa]